MKYTQNTEQTNQFNEISSLDVHVIVSLCFIHYTHSNHSPTRSDLFEKDFNVKNIGSDGISEKVWSRKTTTKSAHEHRTESKRLPFVNQMD